MEDKFSDLAQKIGKRKKFSGTIDNRYGEVPEVSQGGTQNAEKAA